jgi:RHS repeat-associated protein
VSDRKIPIDANLDGVIDYYNADVVSAQDYYPFGMLMPGRDTSVGKYRYGFNGKENDNEVKGEGNSIDFGARIYDSRIANWLSTDPLQKKYPNESPYNFVSQNPILYVDKDGRDKVISITLYDKNGNRTLITQTDKNYFEYKMEFEADASFGNKIKYYKTNVYEEYVIDLANPKNNTFKSGSTIHSKLKLGEYLDGKWE